MFHQNNPSEGPDRSDPLDQFLQSRINEIRTFASVLSLSQESDSEICDLEDFTLGSVGDLVLREMDRANAPLGEDALSLGIGSEGEALLFVRRSQGALPEVLQVDRIHEQIEEVVTTARRLTELARNSLIYIEQQQGDLATVFTVVNLTVPGTDQCLIAIARDYNVRLFDAGSINDDGQANRKFMESLSDEIQHEDPAIEDGSRDALATQNYEALREALMNFRDMDGQKWRFDLTESSRREVLVDVVSPLGALSGEHGCYNEHENSNMSGVPLSLDFMNINLLTEVSPADRNRFQQLLSSFAEGLQHFK